MGLFCFNRGKARLSSLVLLIGVLSTITWLYFALQLQVEESKQAPRQIFDETPAPEKPVVTTTLTENIETVSEFWTPALRRQKKRSEYINLTSVFLS